MEIKKNVSLILVVLILLLSSYFIYKQLAEFYIEDDSKLVELKKFLEPLFPKNEQYSGVLEPLNNRDILSEISLRKGEKSFTINKTKIFLCLKDKKDEYYNNNMLMYVLLHEIAHCLCDEIGHTEKFHNIFAALLEKATKLNIFDPKKSIDKNYCDYKN
jgi:hypothetical protein